MNNANQLNWDDATRKAIDDAVTAEVMKTRIAQQVIPSIVMDNNPTEVLDSKINIPNLTIDEGKTKSFAEIYVEFSLTGTQVSKEASLGTCKILARMAAKEIALAEDTIIFQGGASKFSSTQVKVNNPAAIAGLLNEPGTLNVTVKKVAPPREGIIFGESIFAGVAGGIAKLNQNAQAPKYALFLPTIAYADTYVPPGVASLVTTAERIKPLVEGGYNGTGTLPEELGLLLSLGGEPITIYVGKDAVVEYVRQQDSNYFFRVVERIQYVVRDARSIVIVEFER